MKRQSDSNGQKIIRSCEDELSQYGFLSNTINYNGLVHCMWSLKSYNVALNPTEVIFKYTL